MIKTVC